MDRKYKRIIIIIIVVLLIACGLGVAYKTYVRNYSREAIIVKLSNLSVNYLDGNVIKTNNQEKVLNFSVINDSTEDVYYAIKIENIKKIGKDVKIVLNEKTSVDLVKQDELVLGKGIKISAGDTQNYSIKIENPNKNNVAFSLLIKEEKEEEITITKTIINNNIIKNSSQTKPGEEISVNDEGLISDLDDLGISYYFRGNVTNNYFKFADKMWRIVRINGDNSVRLILDENVEVLTSFSENAVDYLDTAVYQALKDWFDANLFKYEDYIYTNKYCYDYNLTTDNKTYTSFNRISIAHLPSYNCESKPFSLNIGLLSIDEAIFAGLLINTENKSNYLYNESINDWWLLTPALLDNNKFHPFVVKNDGSIISNVDSTAGKTLRPVINISPYVTIVGDGTKDNPYMISK